MSFVSSDRSALPLLLWSVALPKILAGKLLLFAQKVSQPPKGNLWTNLFCFLFFSLFKFHLEYIPDWALGRGQFFTMIGDVTVLVAALCSAV